MRKNIALFVSFLDNEFSMDVIDGAWLAAEDMNINLFIMPTRLIINNYHEAELTRYEYQYNSMLSYIDPSNFDGVIIETGIICNGMTDDEVKTLFSTFGNLPIINIARKIEGYPNISFNCQGLRDEIQHLIDVHHCRRIAFIGGPPNNAEAIDRFKLYKQTLADNNIPYDEKLYGMGNFSEFCEDEVKRVITLNEGNIDAICFANDRMAIGGYWALEKMGLVPGKDICITGFDDAPSASAMDPMLTTVRSNVSALGYRAVGECINMLNGEPGVDVHIDTSVIVRSSCGCPSRVNVVTKRITEAGSAEHIDPLDLCIEITEFLSGTLGGDSAISRRIQCVTDVFYELLISIASADFDSEGFLEKTYDAIENLDFETIPYNEFSFALDLIRQKALSVAADRKKAENFFYDLYDKIASGNSSKAYLIRQEFHDLSLISTFIVYDVLSNINDESESYFSVIRNIHRHNVVNSFLFIHEFPIVYRNFESWHRPRTERLICYQSGLSEVLVPLEEQKIASETIFRHPHVCDGRHTYIVNPLFYDAEHYGLVFCETGKKDYAYLSWVMIKQISYALKMKRLMEEQMAVQERLSKNMELIQSYNNDLRKKSICDELTGIMNRRGFMEMVGARISDPNNFGRKAVIAFADMNCLKTVNDQFGHDDGDFAVKGVAAILTKCFRTNDVVSRFGGDEFAAFCFTETPDFETLYRRRLTKITDKFNSKSGKPYLVTVSTGIYEFTCTPEINLTQCMNAADALLYEDKKKKPESIIR